MVHWLTGSEHSIHRNTLYDNPVCKKIGLLLYLDEFPSQILLRIWPPCFCCSRNWNHLARITVRLKSVWPFPNARNNFDSEHLLYMQIGILWVMSWLTNSWLYIRVGSPNVEMQRLKNAYWEKLTLWNLTKWELRCFSTTFSVYMNGRKKGETERLYACIY